MILCAWQTAYCCWLQQGLMTLPFISSKWIRPGHLSLHSYPLKLVPPSHLHTHQMPWLWKINSILLPFVLLLFFVSVCWFCDKIVSFPSPGAANPTIARRNMTLPGENGQNLVEWRFRKEQTRGKVIVFGRKLRVSVLQLKLFVSRKQQDISWPTSYRRTPVLCLHWCKK